MLAKHISPFIQFDQWLTSVDSEISYLSSTPFPPLTTSVTLDESPKFSVLQFYL